MILYHYSEYELTEITPQDGPRRHDTEHNAARNRPGVWLIDDAINPPIIGGWVPKYRHAVEVSEDNPYLSYDQSVDDLAAQYASLTGRTVESFNLAKRYFYTGSLSVLEVIPITPISPAITTVEDNNTL